LLNPEKRPLAISKSPQIGHGHGFFFSSLEQA
jgi:hypothetical protein